MFKEKKERLICPFLSIAASIEKMKDGGYCIKKRCAIYNNKTNKCGILSPTRGCAGSSSKKTESAGILAKMLPKTESEK